MLAIVSALVYFCFMRSPEVERFKVKPKTFDQILEDLRADEWLSIELGVYRQYSGLANILGIVNSRKISGGITYRAEDLSSNPHFYSEETFHGRGTHDHPIYGETEALNNMYVVTFLAANERAGEIRTALPQVSIVQVIGANGLPSSAEEIEDLKAEADKRGLKPLLPPA